jgi:hypothetical protein
MGIVGGYGRPGTFVRTCILRTDETQPFAAGILGHGRSLISTGHTIAASILTLGRERRQLSLFQPLPADFHAACRYSVLLAPGASHRPGQARPNDGGRRDEWKGTGKRKEWGGAGERQQQDRKRSLTSGRDLDGIRIRSKEYGDGQDGVLYPLGWANPPPLRQKVGRSRLMSHARCARAAGRQRMSANESGEKASVPGTACAAQVQTGGQPEQPAGPDERLHTA